MKRKPIPTGWREETCKLCRGTGLTSAYTADGSDFLGATECGGCWNGGYFVTPNGRRIAYPGGPFLGREMKRKPKPPLKMGPPVLTLRAPLWPYPLVG